MKIYFYWNQNISHVNLAIFGICHYRGHLCFTNTSFFCNKLSSYPHKLTLKAFYYLLQQLLYFIFRITTKWLDPLLLTMDPRNSAQDVLRCTLCKTKLALMYCNACQTHLCKDCVAIHFFDKSKVHTVVPIEHFLFTLSCPKCTHHPTKQCELHCKQCNIPICASCISSKEHFGHDKVDIVKEF